MDADMNISTPIDVSATDLLNGIKNYRIANPHLEDVEDLVDAFINSCWPSANPYEVTYAAILNEVKKTVAEMVRKAARKTEEWIDTTVQGDLFNNMSVRLPKWLTDRDGNPIQYWKASNDDIIAFLDARLAGINAEIGALEETLVAKNQLKASFKTEQEKQLKVRKIAKENGIDPSTVRYARQPE
jgi:hypothetical protein